MAIRQEANVPLILTIGIVSGLLLVVVAIGVEAWYRAEERAEVALKSRGSVHLPLAEMHQRQMKDLASYRWVRQGPDEQAVLRPEIPLDEARALLIRLGGKMPATQPAAPAPPTQPAQAPAPAPAAQPAPAPAAQPAGGAPGG
jgi:hypothetical protein